jgi:hypothetical protein
MEPLRRPVDRLGALTLSFPPQALRLVLAQLWAAALYTAEQLSVSRRPMRFYLVR